MNYFFVIYPSIVRVWGFLRQRVSLVLVEENPASQYQIKLKGSFFVARVISIGSWKSLRVNKNGLLDLDLRRPPQALNSFFFKKKVDKNDRPKSLWKEWTKNIQLDT